eukprot:3937322-Rhodomonas_salina.2
MAGVLQAGGGSDDEIRSGTRMGRSPVLDEGAVLAFQHPAALDFSELAELLLHRIHQPLSRSNHSPDVLKMQKREPKSSNCLISDGVKHSGKQHADQRSVLSREGSDTAHIVALLCESARGADHKTESGMSQVSGSISPKEGQETCLFRKCPQLAQGSSHLPHRGACEGSRTQDRSCIYRDKDDAEAIYQRERESEREQNG